MGLDERASTCTSFPVENGNARVFLPAYMATWGAEESPLPR
jgi:hypothetical protein